MRYVHDIRRNLQQRPPTRGPSPGPSEYIGPLHYIHRGGVHVGGSKNYSLPPPSSWLEDDWKTDTGKKIQAKEIQAKETHAAFVGLC